MQLRNSEVKYCVKVTELEWVLEVGNGPWATSFWIFHKNEKESKTLNDIVEKKAFMYVRAGKL